MDGQWLNHTVFNCQSYSHNHKTDSVQPYEVLRPEAQQVKQDVQHCDAFDYYNILHADYGEVNIMDSTIKAKYVM